jgi:hypothetical protein
MISARRLLRMNLGEMTHRGRQAVYKHLERIAAGARSARRLPSLWRAENAYPVGAGSFFAGVEDPRTPGLLAERFPAEQAAIVQGADALCRSRFDLLGYRGLSFGEPVDWHLDPISGKRSPLEHWSLLDPLDVERHGDVKVVWELNRHQQLVRLGQAYRATQDERYAEAAGSLLSRWLEQNPPGLGINWSSSLEVSLRLISWCWALGLLQTAHGLSDVILEIVPDGLARHAHHIARYTSLYSSPNTHLTGEALGLFYAGVLFPEIRGSFAWRDLGQRILIDQIERQTTGDGLYFEQSTCYQRYTIDLYLQFLILAEVNGVRIPRAVGGRVEQLLDSLLALRAPDGRIPAIGDSDGGTLLPLVSRAASDASGSFAVAAALFGRPDYAWAAGQATPELLWLLGPAGLAAFDALTPAPPTRTPSCLFPEGGYAVMRGSWESDAHQLIFDFGPLGCPLSAGHGHADLLSIQCSSFGEPCLVDPGTYCYAVDPRWRDALRESTAHSTVVIDGVSQAETSGPFAWQARPRARLRGFRSEPDLDFADAEHTAYERLAEPVRHRRRVLFLKPRYWVVVDDLAGTGRHDVALRFQLDAWTVERLAAPWIAARGPSAGLILGAFVAGSALEPAVRIGDLERIEGWTAPDYGVRLAAPAVVYSIESTVPLRLVSVLLPSRRTSPARMRLPRVLPVPGETGALQVEYGRDWIRIENDFLRVRTNGATHELS